MPWPWQRKVSRPFGPDFTIESVTPPDPPSNTPVIYTLPYDRYTQLIGTTLSLKAGVLPPTQYSFIQSMRGGTRLYLSRIPAPGTIAGQLWTSGAVNHTSVQDRSADYWGTFRLADYWYLYPHDTVEIHVQAPLATSITISDVIFTFKVWRAL